MTFLDFHHDHTDLAVVAELFQHHATLVEVDVADTVVRGRVETIEPAARERIEAGMVSINDGIFSNEVIPFGGWKESGLGREGGVEGLEEYLETKFVNFGGFA